MPQITWIPAGPPKTSDKLKLRDRVSPERFYKDMKSLVGNHIPGDPKSDQNLKHATAYMVQMLKWTGYLEGAEVVEGALKRQHEHDSIR